MLALIKLLITGEVSLLDLTLILLVFAHAHTCKCLLPNLSFEIIFKSA